MDLGSAGRGSKTKNPPCLKAWRDLRKSSKKALKLFSSFLRGASCPKSPRFKRNGMKSSPSRLHPLSFRSHPVSSETSKKPPIAVVSRFSPRELLCPGDNKTSPSCVQYASACGIRILGVLFPGEAHGSNSNLSTTRSFVQCRFCRSLLHPQPAVNAGVILYGRRDFFRVNRSK